MSGLVLHTHQSHTQKNEYKVCWEDAMIPHLFFTDRAVYTLQQQNPQNHKPVSAP